MKNKQYSFIFTLLLILISSNLYSQRLSQDEKEFIRRTNEADGYFIYDEDYPKAAEIYKELFKEYPENHNIAYKLGVCYLNILGSELKSLDLLRFASKNYVNDLEYSTVGAFAPFDVLYYLAFSCQVNLRIEEAIENYEKYKKLLPVKEAAEIDYIDNQVKACNNILKATEEGVILIKSLFAPWFTDYRNSANPVVSGNDSVLAFTVVSEAGNKIFISKRINGSWEEPFEISNELGKFRDMFTNSITSDGRILIISRNNGIKGDLYISRFDGKRWQKITKLGKNINTRYWESHGAISADGTQLCFASNKPGGYGSLDIYLSELQDNGSFGPAVNLGPVINTNLEENTPFLDSDGSLYFSSTGHNGFGGYDIFYSARQSQLWSEPVQLSFPMNNPTNNLHYIPYGSFNRGISSLPLNDTATSTTIFQVTHGIKPLRDRITAEGEINLGDDMSIDPSLLKLEIFQDSIGNSGYLIKSDSDGRFSYGLDSSSYSLIVSYPGYSTDTINISIPKSFTGNSISIKRELSPLSIASGEFFSIRNILFDFDKDELDRDAKLTLEKILPVLIENPALRIEIKGFTDAIGSSAYNLKLSERRANSVFKYMVDSGIDPVRISATGRGETEFISKNIATDGSDNPEGRIYNRRVSVSILNDGYEIYVESSRFIPRHLKRKQRFAYYVVLQESDLPLNPGYFKTGSLGELTLVSEIKSGDLYKYFVGEFSSRTDAINFLNTVRDVGFDSSYITDEYELSEESIDSNGSNLYTIQIHALLNSEKYEFKNLKNVRVIKGNDGFYRYIVGEYKGYSRALEALKVIHSMGYPQSYIKDFSLLETQTLKR